MPNRLLGWAAVLIALGALAVVLATRGKAPAASSPSKSLAKTAGGSTPAGRSRRARAGHTLRPHGFDEASATPTTTPGVAAFREYTDDYVQMHIDDAQEHMANEGISLEETKELTYFAFVVLESQDWDVVEDLTGHPIEEEARRQASVEMRRRSQQMRDEVLEQVRSGEGEEARWATIGRVESGYLAEYYRITGMNPELLDQLLLQSVNSNHIWETSSAAAPHATPQAPSGAKDCMKRDPAHPDAPPVPVACP
jgi:hypothetical protein